MRRCKIAPPSCRHPDKPCWRDCGQLSCDMHCENHPSRCNCVEVPPPRKGGGGKGRSRFLDWDEIARLRSQGLTIAQIAEQIPCSQGSVCNALKKRGVVKDG